MAVDLSYLALDVGYFIVTVCSSKADTDFAIGTLDTTTFCKVLLSLLTSDLDLLLFSSSS